MGVRLVDGRSREEILRRILPVSADAKSGTCSAQAVASMGSGPAMTLVRIAASHTVCVSGPI